MTDRSIDWLEQAEADLNHARSSVRIEDHEWACFAAQQAAEKALKAVYESLHGEGWGHSVSKLIAELPDEHAPDPALLDSAKALDKLYIPSRYPNGFASGKPRDYFTRDDAQQAIDHAESILAYCRTTVRGS